MFVTVLFGCVCLENLPQASVSSGSSDEKNPSEHWLTILRLKKKKVDTKNQSVPRKARCHYIHDLATTFCYDID